MQSGSRRDVNYYAKGGTRVVFMTTAGVANVFMTTAGVASVFMTTAGVASDSKVGTMKTVGFQCTCRTAYIECYTTQRLKSWYAIFRGDFFPRE